jgi:hypothetical protein
MPRPQSKLATASFGLPVRLLLLLVTSCASEKVTEVDQTDDRLRGIEQRLAPSADNTALCVEYIGLCEQGLALCLSGSTAQDHPSFCSNLTARCNLTVEQFCRSALPDAGAGAPVTKDGGQADADGGEVAADGGQAGADAGAPSTSDAGNAAGPRLSAINARDVTQTTANINWTLNEPGTGQVDYGPTPTYGQSSRKETSFQYSAHLQALSGLLPGTTYHFRVRSSNQAGVESISADFTFTTIPITTPVDAGTGTSLKYPADTTMDRSRTVPAMAKPAYLVPAPEPTFGTTIVRINDAAAFGAADVSHAYSKNQPWNCDGTLLYLRNYLLDGNTYQIKTKSFPRSGDMIWSYKDPNKMFAFGGGRAVRIDVTTLQTTLIANYTGFANNGLGFGEGNISWDDKYAALATQDASSQLIVRVLNLETGAFETSKAFPGIALNDIDWVSMSPSGKYVVIHWRGPARPVVAYDRLTMNVVSEGPGGHADLGYDMAGNEVLVSVVCGGQPETPYGSMAARRLDTGEVTFPLKQFSGHYCGHASTRNYKRPGWAYLTDGGPEGTGEMYAVKLDGSQTVERFAHTRAATVEYSAQAKGTVSPDGTKVLFTSNWGVGGAELNEYVVWQR